MIELLVVFSTVGVLSTLLFSSMSTAREKSRQAKCINNQHMLMSAVMMFGLDHDRYPEQLYPDQYDTNPDILGYYDGKVETAKCPKVEGTFDASVYSYAILEEMTGVNISAVNEPTRTMILVESNLPIISNDDYVAYRHLGRCSAAFADGHIELVKNIRFLTLGEETEIPIANPDIEYPITLEDNGFIIKFYGGTDNGDATTTFKFSITNNNGKKLTWAKFSIPDGTEAFNLVSYGDAAIYQIKDNFNQPFYCARFKRITGDGIRDGMTDFYEYTLNNADITDYVVIQAAAKASNLAANVSFDN